jgi:hypothetical protein
MTHLAAPTKPRSQGHTMPWAWRIAVRRPRSGDLNQVCSSSGEGVPTSLGFGTPTPSTPVCRHTALGRHNRLVCTSLQESGSLRRYSGHDEQRRADLRDRYAGAQLGSRAMRAADLDHPGRGPARRVTRGRAFVLGLPASGPEATWAERWVSAQHRSYGRPLCPAFRQREAERPLSAPDAVRVEHACESVRCWGWREACGARRAAHVRAGATRLLRRDGVPRPALLGQRGRGRRCTTTGPPAGVATDLGRTALAGPGRLRGPAAGQRVGARRCSLRRSARPLPRGRGRSAASRPVHTRVESPIVV